MAANTPRKNLCKLKYDKKEKQTKQSNEDIHHERWKMFDISSMFAYHILRVL